MLISGEKGESKSIGNFEQKQALKKLFFRACIIFHSDRSTIVDLSTAFQQSPSHNQPFF